MVRSYKRIAAAAAVFCAAATVCVPCSENRAAPNVKSGKSEVSQLQISACAESDTTNDGGYDGFYDTYNDKLADIERRQQELDEQLSGDDEEILDKAEQQKLILEQVNIINDKLTVLNSYMTAMQIKIDTEQDNLNAMRAELDEGIDRYKQRLRAVYLAGDLSYAEVVLGAGDFFDMLMRAELMERVNAADAKSLDKLVKKKTEYDEKMKDLEQEQALYKDQTAVLEREKKDLAELYDSEGETRKLLREHKEKLEEDQRVYQNEVYSYEGILDDLLLGSYSGEWDEPKRIETEKQAKAALEQLQANIQARKDSGETIPDTECQYTFKWPTEGLYYISSGVGARWGTYHSGIDIPGDGGYPITAAEAGEVVRVNNGCTHNYGKYGSCGCGGGYGNFVIIDHGNGFLTLYGHMTQTKVSVGDKVKEGQEIGLMGSTGYSTGTHLHLELRYGGYVTDPSNFMKY